MSRTSTYLTFLGNTEEAFNFYKSVFNTEFLSPIDRMKDAPSDPSQPPLSEEDGNKVMHVALPILGGHVIMGTDLLESRGDEYKPGTAISLNLEPDTIEETQRLFTALSQGGVVTMPLETMFWGATYGQVTDKYGIQWMFNCTESA